MSVSILDEYKARRKDYQMFTESLHSEIKVLLRDLDAKGSIVAIDPRTKEVASFEEKLQRKPKPSLDLYTDLSGVRIICYIQEENDQICKILVDNLLIDWPNSVDKTKMLQPDQFGYRSVHYIASYKPKYIELPRYSAFAGMKAEIQVRTICQHAWAGMDWKLRYKAEEEGQVDVKRRLFRISALLETADEEFAQMTKMSRKREEGFRKSIKEGNLDIEISQESLESFFHENTEAEDKDKTKRRPKGDTTLGRVADIAKKIGYQIRGPNPRTRVPTLNLQIALQKSGIANISDLVKILDRSDGSIVSALEEVFNEWDTLTKAPQRPKTLDLDYINLVRLIVIYRAPVDVAKLLLENNPFSPSLNAAINKCKTR